MALATLSSRRLLHQLRGAGTDPAIPLEEGTLRVVDWYSHKEEEREVTEREGGVARCAGTLDALEEALEAALEERDVAVAILDVLTDAAAAGPTRFAAFLARAREALAETPRTILILEPDLVPATIVDQVREGVGVQVHLERLPTSEGPTWRLTLERDGDGREVYGLRTSPPFLDFTVGEPSGEAVDVVVSEETGAPTAEEPPRGCPQCQGPLEGGVCTACGYSEEEARLVRIQEIHRACEERLRENPDDVDALFTKAVALARMKEYEAAVEVLNDLTRRSPRYPALWMLKAKVFDRKGDEVKANLCRQRALQLEQEEYGTSLEVRVTGEQERFQCPLCHRWLPLEATVCPCGAEFVEEEG